MRKGWLVFVLVLIISAQLVVLSSFRDVEADGFANGNSVIAIAKWDYVQAGIRISVTPQPLSVTPQPLNESEPVKLVFSNGTSISINSTYTITLQLPRTGDFFGNAAIGGTLALSEDQPLNAVVEQNVGNVTSYVNLLKESETSSAIPACMCSVDLYVLVVVGAAQVSVAAYGVSL